MDWVRLPVACALVAAFAAGAAGGSAAPAASTLLVQDAATGEVVLPIPVEEGSTVTLAYTHSVEKTPVRDVYEVRDDRLEMVRMEFNSYGAGLPSGANVTETENESYAFDPGGSYEELYVQPGAVAGHRLIVDDREYDLVNLTNERTVRLHLVATCASGPTAAPNETDAATGVSET